MNEGVKDIENVNEIEKMLMREDLSAKEYKELTKRLNEIRQAKIETKLHKMGLELIEYCSENEIPLKEGLGMAGLGGGLRKIPIKYRDPEDHENVWAGRGRTPIWYKNRIKEGYTPSELKVKESKK